MPTSYASNSLEATVSEARAARASCLQATPISLKEHGPTLRIEQHLRILEILSQELFKTVLGKLSKSYNML